MEEEQGGSETKMVETGVQSIGRLAAAAAKGSSAATAAALGAAGPKLLQSSSTEREQRGRETGMVGIGVRSIELLVPSITVIQFNCTHCPNPNLMGIWDYRESYSYFNFLSVTSFGCSSSTSY